MTSKLISRLSSLVCWLRRRLLYLVGACLLSRLEKEMSFKAIEIDRLEFAC